MEQTKHTQMAIVRNIVADAGEAGIRTEEVKIAAMYKRVSCADRYLRWLAQAGEIVSDKKYGDRTKTWKIAPPTPRTEPDTPNAPEPQKPL